MKRREPVDIAAVGIVHLAEAVTVILFLGVCAMWLIILATKVPA